MKRVAAIAILCFLSLADAQNKGTGAQRPTKVHYLIQVMSDDDKLAGRQAQNVTICLGGRCEALSSQPCPSADLCEIVQIKEVPLQGGGFRYEIKNWLKDYPKESHLQLRTKPLPFPEARTPEEARSKMIGWVHDLLLCHDQSPAHRLDTGEATQAPPACECQQ